jgi:hypothetical protein
MNINYLIIINVSTQLFIITFFSSKIFKDRISKSFFENEQKIIIRKEGKMKVLLPSTHPNFLTGLSVTSCRNVFVEVAHYILVHDIHLPEAISFILLSAEPALNHVICCSFNVWLSSIVSVLPSLCLISHFTGFPGARSLRPRRLILSVG